MDTKYLVTIEDKRFIQAVRLCVNNITTTNGELMFFALFVDINNSDTVSVFVSAKWLDDMTPREGVSIIVKALRESLSIEMMRNISRISVIKTKDTRLRQIIGIAVSTIRGGIITLKNCKINNIDVPYAVIFESTADN